MKQTINQSQFIDAFALMGRKEQFSYDGLIALFEYLENYEEETNTEIELDVIALCCEYSEYANIDELKKDYSSIETLKDLEDKTTVIPVGTDGLIIQQF